MKQKNLFERAAEHGLTLVRCDDGTFLLSDHSPVYKEAGVEPPPPQMLLNAWDVKNQLDGFEHSAQYNFDRPLYIYMMKTEMAFLPALRAVTALLAYEEVPFKLVVSRRHVRELNERPSTPVHGFIVQGRKDEIMYHVYDVADYLGVHGMKRKR